MNKAQLVKELKQDEGVKYEMYKDHLGYPTIGVGHLILEGEDHLLTATLTEEQVSTMLLHDLVEVIKDCQILYKGYDDMPEEAQLVLANMMYNIGRTKLTKFVKTNTLFEEQKWLSAASEMLDSRWAKQVPNRAQRLADRITKLGNNGVDPAVA